MSLRVGHSRVNPDVYLLSGPAQNWPMESALLHLPAHIASKVQGWLIISAGQFDKA